MDKQNTITITRVIEWLLGEHVCLYFTSMIANLTTN
jgi:hypothetical protein